MAWSCRSTAWVSRAVSAPTRCSSRSTPWRNPVISTARTAFSPPKPTSGQTSSRTLRPCVSTTYTFSPSIWVTKGQSAACSSVTGVVWLYSPYPPPTQTAVTAQTARAVTRRFFQRVFFSFCSGAAVSARTGTGRCICASSRAQSGHSSRCARTMAVLAGLAISSAYKGSRSRMISQSYFIGVFPSFHPYNAQTGERLQEFFLFLLTAAPGWWRCTRPGYTGPGSGRSPPATGWRRRHHSAASTVPAAAAPPPCGA